MRAVNHHGRVLERSRFRRCPGPARSRALAQLDEFEKDESGRLVIPAADDDAPAEWEEVLGFDEIPPSLLRPEDYRLTQHGRWRYS